jgi:serine/threonine protein kinase
LGKELGRGAFGVVYKAELNGKAIACKMLSKETAQEMNEDEFLQEARTMSEIPRHPNVIQLLGFCRDETICILSGKEKKGSQEKRNKNVLNNNSFFCETEFVGGGCLRPLLMDLNEHLSVAQQLKFMVEIANGMAHLHRYNIIHR